MQQITSLMGSREWVQDSAGRRGREEWALRALGIPAGDSRRHFALRYAVAETRTWIRQLASLLGRRGEVRDSAGWRGRGEWALALWGLLPGTAGGTLRSATRSL